MSGVSPETRLHLIEGFTLLGDIVVDPCMGVGSAALAAQRTGGRFVGCDIDEYCVNETKRGCRRNPIIKNKMNILSVLNRERSDLGESKLLERANIY